jgi:anthranilate/para-aminobenzoate synthase component I
MVWWLKVTAGNPLDFASSNINSDLKWRLLDLACPVFVAVWRATLATMRFGTSRKTRAHSARLIRLGTPDILLLQCEELAVIDNLSGKLYVDCLCRSRVQPDAYAQAQEATWRELKEQLEILGQCARGQLPRQTYPAATQTSQRRLPGGVLQDAKELIAAGDFMQVQVGQRIHKQLHRQPVVPLPRA